MEGLAGLPQAAITADVVLLTVRADTLQVLLVRRGVAPHKGRLALPGGFVRPHEDLAEAAARELGEETAVVLPRLHLEQLATYGAPRRDPRGRVVTVAYLGLGPDLPDPQASTDAADARWMPVEPLLSRQRGGLAFDHARILADGVERARSKLEYTPLATAFCASEFTIAELRRVYEAVWGVELDPRNFHRKVTSVEELLVETGERTKREGGRPAMLYRRGPAALLMPPLLRPY